VPGPSRVTPFLGGLVEMVMDPYSFWERQKDAANVTNPGYSYNSLAGKMILTVTDAGARRRALEPPWAPPPGQRAPPWPPRTTLPPPCLCQPPGLGLPPAARWAPPPGPHPPLRPPRRRQVPRADGGERP
jgi:hypothetical protein